MKKIITLLLIVGTFVCSVFAKDVAEGYWISIDEKTNSITAGWKFYVNAQGQMEAVIVFTPGCNSTTLADGCKDLKSVSDFPVKGELSKMKVLNETPWIYGLSKTAEGVWDNGSIIDCGEGKKYSCKVTFAPADGKKYKTDTLIMRGSIGPVGRSQLWRRPDAEIMETLKSQLMVYTDYYVTPVSDFIELLNNIGEY